MDTRPPVWDMALHQIYALNYVELFAKPTTPALSLGLRPSGPLLRGATSPFPGEEKIWELSGNYPPLVHLFIAGTFAVLHPSPRVAALANVPATLLLFWALLELGRYFTSEAAARWACILVLLTPYLIWMSRETILDYWLSAWVAAAWVVLIRTHGFESRFWSRVFGLVCACGLLTKWLFAAFMVLPFLVVAIRHRIWKHEKRLIHGAQSLMLSAAIAALWYLPNLSHLIQYFRENAQIGALEGEPPVFSFQSFIYYLRLLEGYQLYAVLFLLLVGGLLFVTWRGLLRDPVLWIAMLVGGWMTLTLLRTKDPRFTMPLLAPLLLLPGAWLASWNVVRFGRLMQILLISVLLIQAYATNFGVSWLPQQAILMSGYQGSLRWDWQLFSQHYFGILGAPRQENWKQREILNRVSEEAPRQGAAMSLALVPDLPRFNYFNFQLAAKLAKMPMHVGHLQSAIGGLAAFDGYDFAVTTENDQGMPWSTRASASLNQFIVDAHDIFKIVATYNLPNGDAVRLYFIDRKSNPARQ